MAIEPCGYDVKTQDVLIGAHTLQIRTLKDLQQYYDPLGYAEKIGISSANWSLFGVLWQSAFVLARVVDQLKLEHKSVLEIGCGIALPGIVAAQNGAKVTVSDYHPLAEAFLDKNTDLNDMDKIRFVGGDWRLPNKDFKRYDLIIGSDILYERGHPEQLADFFERHASDHSTVIITDPVRKLANRLTKCMELRGYTARVEDADETLIMNKRYRGKILRYERKASH